MSYIGNPIISTDFPKDTFSGNGATVAFTMSIAPASVNAVIVVVSGITQDPSTYTISGTTLTFSAAPPTGTSNISVRHLGIAGIPNTPSAGSVVNASMSTGAPYWDTSGNVGIGTSSPTDTNGFGKALDVQGSTGAALYVGASGDRATYGYASGELHIRNPSASGTTRFYMNGTERMRITSDGTIAFGTTTFTGATGISLSNASDSAAYGKSMYFNSPYNGTRNAISFGYNTSGVGAIVTGTSSTSYNTSSDYRLKENVAPLTGSGAFIDGLQPKTWTWKVDGKAGVGFIAHEAQLVAPQSVQGIKDAVDAEGKPVLQSMEYGSAEFIANMILELQSLRQRVAALEQQQSKGTV